MRAKELRQRSIDELEGLLKDTRDKLFSARMKNATHQLSQTHQLREYRREVARILTVLSEKRRLGEGQE